MRALLKADFHLYAEYYKRNEVNQTIWSVNMLIILLLTFWYVTIQYRKGELRWIFFVYMFFKTNYIWILLWYATLHWLVNTLHWLEFKTWLNTSKTITNALIFKTRKKINNYLLYEERTKSYASSRHRRKSYFLFTYLWIQYKKKKYKRNEVLKVLIQLS